MAFLHKGISFWSSIQRYAISIEFDEIFIILHLVIKGTLDEERTDLFVMKASAIRQMKGKASHQKRGNGSSLVQNRV